MSSNLNAAGDVTSTAAIKPLRTLDGKYFPIGNVFEKMFYLKGKSVPQYRVAPSLDVFSTQTWYGFWNDQAAPSATAQHGDYEGQLFPITLEHSPRSRYRIRVFQTQASTHCEIDELKFYAPL